MPFYLPKQTSFVRIGAETTVDGEAGSVFRIGVWNSRADYFAPGTLALDAGTIAGDGGAARKEITIDLTLDRGWYWTGGAAQVSPSTAPTMRTVILSGDQSPNLFVTTSAPTAGQTLVGYSEASVTGAFGASFGTPTAAGSAARIHLKTA
jgi:hypothetical protein